ncbi:MAG: HAMP domain-containing histidine kinase [Oscillospiraceae bacterium]|nr:HAMP domain-containing histidine kinase [Oscillospiraceae bacterium]
MGTVSFGRRRVGGGLALNIRSFRKSVSAIIHGIKQRWMRGSVLAVAVMLVVAIAAFTAISASSLYTTMRTGLEMKAKTATDFFANYIMKSYAEYYDSAYQYAETFDENDRLELQFIGTDKRVVVSTTGITAGTVADTEDVSNVLKTGAISHWTGRRAGTGERVMGVSAPMVYTDGQVIGIMRYVTSMKLADRQVLLRFLLACAIAAVMMLIVIIINLFFIRSFIEPVGEITKTAKRIAEGSYGIQINKEYKDEMGEMVQSINEMSQKIAQAEKIQTEFIMSISHELRTPLTAITGWGETLSYNEDIDGETRRGISIILKEARRLTKMVEELLEFTRMEDGRFTLNVEQIDVGAVLEDSIFTYKELLHQDGIELEYDPYMDDVPLISGDPARLKQVFMNLFDNAAKYGKSGGRITVSLAVEESDVVIRVRDYGPGIPEDELQNVKMKFYKGSNAKERGSGIGLAVCDEIVGFHGGSLMLENAQGGGLLVTVRLPAGD